MSDDNRALVQRGYEAFGRGDIPGLLALFDADMEWVTPGPPDFPLAGTRRGPQQAAEFFQTLDAVFEIQEFEPLTFVAEGDRVIVLGREKTRVRATGAIIDNAWVHAFTVKNGKIVALQEFFDTAAVMAELRAAQARA